MQNSTIEIPHISKPSRPKEITLSDAFAFLMHHRKKFLLAGTISTLLGYGFSFTLPVIYTATAQTLPPQQQQSGLSSMLSQLPISMSGNGLIKDQPQLYIGLFKTTVITNRIISLFNLKTHYKRGTLSDTRDALLASVRFTAGKDTIIKIEVDDQNPSLAAQIANAYPEELNKFLQSLTISEASQKRKFFEAQLQQSKQQLTQAEIHFKELQEQSGILRLEEQGHAALAETSALRAQIASKEVEIQALKISATDASPAVKYLQAELDALHQQLNQLENNSNKKDVPSDVNLNKLPLKGMEYIRRYRDLKFQETMYELMIKQYELARIEEARTTQTVQLIDPALIPEKRSRPKRSQVALTSGIFGLFLTFIFTFIRNKNKTANT